MVSHRYTVRISGGKRDLPLELKKLQKEMDDVELQEDLARSCLFNCFIIIVMFLFLYIYIYIIFCFIIKNKTVRAFVFVVSFCFVLVMTSFFVLFFIVLF